MNVIPKYWEEVGRLIAEDFGQAGHPAGWNKYKIDAFLIDFCDRVEQACQQDSNKAALCGLVSTKNGTTSRPSFSYHSFRRIFITKESTGNRSTREMFAIYLGFDSMNALLIQQGIADGMPSSATEIEQPALPRRPKRYRHLLITLILAMPAAWMLTTYFPMETLGDQQPYIFIKNENGIAVVDLNAGTTHQLIETKIVIGLDFDPENRMLYWANADDNYKCLSCVRLASDWKSIELGSLNTRLTECMEYPAGIALDREAKRIYCADYGNSSIWVFDCAGNLLSKALTGSMEGKPSSVEFDPENRVLYWTDVVTHKIGRVFLDNGGQEPNFITSSGRWPDGLSIDIGRRKLYWACNKSGEIAWANLDDEHPTPHFTTLLPRPSAVEVDPVHQVLYHCDWNSSVIRRIKIGESGLLPEHVKSGALWTGGASPGVMKLFFRQAAIDSE